MLTKLRVNKQTGSSARRILRMRYRDHQTVRGANLRDEQTYRRAMHRRHLLTAHDWGIVTGLALVASGDDAVVVEPGVAVDLYGRLVILAEPVTIHQADLESFEGGNKVEIGIRYCDLPVSASRIQESGMVFVATTVLEPDRVADYLQLDPPPESAPPLYLGTIKRDGLIMEGIPQKARLFAGSVISPDERVGVMLDTEAENDSRRFAVASDDPETGALQDRLMINRLGNTYLMGNAEVTSPTPDTPLLNLFGMTLRLEANVPPAAANPWRMYTAQGIEGEGDDQRPFNELRVELFHPGKVGEPQNYRLEICAEPSKSAGAGERKPLFTVVADGTVIVHGMLDADQIFQAPIQADPTDPRFLELLDLPKFLSEGLEVGVVGAQGDMLELTQGDKAKITLKNLNTSLIDPVSVYLDIRTASANPIPGSPFRLQDTTLAADETKQNEVTEINTSTPVTLLVTVVAYGNKPNGDVVVGYKIVRVSVKPAARN